MTPDFGWLSILPPVLAIAMALRTRQVHLSLFAGIWIGATVLEGFNPVAGATTAIEALVTVIVENPRTLLFTLMVGALILLVQESGGVAGFANWMVARGWVRGKKSAQLISAVLGISIFIESNVTCLVTGTVSRPLYDRVGLSRQKLAYICDSTSAPICMLIPINAWGALILGLLAAEGLDDPLGVLIASLPFNFYALLTLGLVFWVTFTGRDFGAMRAAEEAVSRSDSRPDGDPTDNIAAGTPERGRRPMNLILPVVAMVAIVPVVLTVTGGGDWRQGSGSTSVLWATSGAVLLAMILYRIQRLFSFVEMTEISMRGFQELVPVAAILGLAIGLGNICDGLGTGPWVADSVAPYLGVWTVAPLVFLTGCLIAFSTGSSWGTFGILMPIAIPLALESGASLPLVVGAVMGGGIFGDHCSPISDTTVVSSMSAGCDHIEHVTTQLPYALSAGAAACALYLIAGLAL